MSWWPETVFKSFSREQFPSANFDVCRQQITERIYTWHVTSHTRLHTRLKSGASGIMLLRSYFFSPRNQDSSEVYESLDLDKSSEVYNKICSLRLRNDVRHLNLNFHLQSSFIAIFRILKLFSLKATHNCHGDAVVREARHGMFPTHARGLDAQKIYTEQENRIN